MMNPHYQKEIDKLVKDIEWHKDFHMKGNWEGIALEYYLLNAVLSEESRKEVEAALKTSKACSELKEKKLNEMLDRLNFLTAIAGERLAA
jgi:hypothetical protein